MRLASCCDICRLEAVCSLSQCNLNVKSTALWAGLIFFATCWYRLFSPEWDCCFNCRLQRNDKYVDFIEKQTMQFIFKPLVALFVASIVISGCASRSAPASAPPNSAALYRDALQALDAGEKEKGMELLDASARANPASAMPWVKMAQVHFDADNYPSAIEAADEAMKRDPSRRDAKALAVVASLRVAVRALSDMSSDTSLRGNTRSEAERLARSLRETLGQDELVPLADDAPAKSRTLRPSAGRPAAASAASRPAVPAAAPSTATKAASGSAPNPFSSLK